MKTLAIAVAALAALALPSAARTTSDSIAFAITHFNQGLKTSDRVVIPGLDSSVALGSEPGSAQGRAIDRFNGDLDGNAVIRAHQGTVWPGTPAHGAALFEALGAEDDD